MNYWALALVLALPACSRQSPQQVATGESAAVASAAARTTVASPPDDPIYAVGGDVKAPVVIYRVEPPSERFPKVVSLAGPLILSAVVGSDGSVRSVAILRDAVTPPVGHLYVEAMKHWRFRPATFHGTPVTTRMMFTVNIHVD